MIDQLVGGVVPSPQQTIKDLFPEGSTRPEFSVETPGLLETYLRICDRLFGDGQENKVIDVGRREVFKATIATAAIAPVVFNPLLRRMIPPTDTITAAGNSLSKGRVDNEPGHSNVGKNEDIIAAADSLTDEEFEKKLNELKDELEAAGKAEGGHEGEESEEGAHSEEKLSYLGKGVMGVMLVHFATTVGQIAKSKGEKTFNEFSAARSMGLAFTCDFLLQKFGNEADKHFGHEIIHELTGGKPPINLILTGALSVLTNITALMENKIIEQLNLDEERIGTDKPKRGLIERTKSKLGREREQELELATEEKFSFFEPLRKKDDDRSLIDFSSTDIRNVVQQRIGNYSQEEGERLLQQKELKKELEKLNEYYKDMLVSTTSRGMGMIGALSPVFTTYLGADLGNQLGNELLDIAAKKKLVDDLLSNFDQLTTTQELESALQILEATSAVETAINMNKLGGLRGAIMFYAANASGLIGIGDPPNIFAITEALERDFLPEYVIKSQGEGIVASLASGISAANWSLKESFDINPLKNPRFMAEFGKGITIGLGKVGKGLISPLATLNEIMKGTTVDDIEDFRVVRQSDIERFDAFRSLRRQDGSVVSLHTLLKHLNKEDIYDEEERESIEAEITALSYNLEDCTSLNINRVRGLLNKEEFIVFLDTEEAASSKSYDELIANAKTYRDNNPHILFDLGQFAREVLQVSTEESESDALVREFFAKVKDTRSRSFVMPGFVVKNSIIALGHSLQDGAVNLVTTLKDGVKDPRELVGKAVFLETEEHHEAGLTIFDRLVEGQEISNEEFLRFLNGFNLASGNTDIIQSIMSFTVMTGTNGDVPSGAEMTTISKYMSDFIIKLGEHRNEEGMLKVVNRVNKFFENYKEVLIAKFSNGEGKETIDYAKIKPELVDTLLKMLDEGVANPELTELLGVSYDDLNVVDKEALRDAVVKMAGFNVEESEIAEGLSHSAKEVLYALLTQLSHVGAMIESAKSVFGSVDDAMGDLEPKAKLMLKLGLSTLLTGGVSMFADNVAAFLFGIATNDKIVEDYIESVGGLPGGEKQAKSLKLEGFMLSLWTAIMAGSLFKSGNGPNFSLLNQHPQVEIDMREVDGTHTDDALIRDFVINDSDTEESILAKLKKLGLNKELSLKWYQENAGKITDKQFVMKPKVLLTPSGGLNTTQSPVDFIESFKMSKYWLWRVILPILSVRTGMLFKQASTA